MSRRWIWRILPYTDVSENLRPSSGNILASPRPVCPSRVGSFAVVFIRLSMCLYRGFASWSRNLGKLLLDCMASHPRGLLCSTGYQTVGRHLPPQNDANTWLNDDFVGITCEYMERCISHYFIYKLCTCCSIPREHCVSCIFQKEHHVYFLVFWNEHRFGNWICFTVVRWRCSAPLHLVR
jgi:hypothetical protein